MVMGVIQSNHTHRKLFLLKKDNQLSIWQKILECGLQVPEKALLTRYGCGLALATPIVSTLAIKS